MRIEDIKYKDITNEIVDKVLFEGIQYTEDNADVAVVLGSSSATKYRVPMAVKLYKDGKTDKLLFCGGKKFSEDGKETEAKAMLKKAVELGVATEDIHTESDSFSTIENVKNAAKYIEAEMPDVKKVILVTTTFHMKRSLLLARKVFPQNVDIIPCPADDINTKRDTWFNNKAGVERAVGEVIGIVDYINKKEIDSFEI